MSDGSANVLPWTATPKLPASSQAAPWLELIEHVARASGQLQQALAGLLVDVGLSESQFWLLWNCSRAAAGGRSQNELAAAMRVSPAQVSGLVEALGRSGLVQGERAVGDRRRQLWQITSAGLACLDRIATAIDRRLASDHSQRQAGSHAEPLDSLRGPVINLLDQLVALSASDLCSAAQRRECA